VTSNNDNNLTSREKILHYLLVRSAPENLQHCTVKEMADNLAISENGIRQHLEILKKNKLVVQRVLHEKKENGNDKKKTGRPATVYSLNDAGYNQFPKIYPQFTLDLLAKLKSELGIERTNEILHTMGQETGQQIKEFIINNITKKGMGDTLEERLNHVVTAYQHYGKFPILERDGDDFILKTFNCLVYTISKENRQVCIVDKAILTELVGCEMVKEKCLHDGDGMCQYRASQS